MDNVYISRSDFQAWVELLGKTDVYTRDSKLRVFATLSNGVKAEFVFCSIKTIRGERFYGRDDEFDTVRVDTFANSNFHLTGKGSRSNESYEECATLLSLLSEEITRY